MSDDIDHEFTTNVVCPHCGHVHWDSWEMHDGTDDDEFEHDCDKCGMTFAGVVHVQVTYSTRK